MEADRLKIMIEKRTGIGERELVCPREKSDMTPCVCRDGDAAMTGDKRCVGCGAAVLDLLEEEFSNV